MQLVRPCLILLPCHSPSLFLCFLSCCILQNDEFYNNLLAGKSGVTEISSFDTSGFSTRFAGEIKVRVC